MMRFDDNRAAVIGIDLHGTLLNEYWKISDQELTELLNLLPSIKQRFVVLICTGNDLMFVEDSLPGTLRDLVDGYILENGSLCSDGESQTLLISNQEVEMIKRLELELKQMTLPDLLFFGHRLGSISLFTKNRNTGLSPDRLYRFLKSHLCDHPDYHNLHITHSDVAVDIIPRGHSKWTAIKSLCKDQKIIAVADSCNDWDFLANAEFSFVPANCSTEIESEFIKEGFLLRPLDLFGEEISIKTVFKSRGNNTIGVIEILNAINNHYNEER